MHSDTVPQMYLGVVCTKVGLIVFPVVFEDLFVSVSLHKI